MLSGVRSCTFQCTTSNLQELYSEIQTQYLPQMLNNLLQGLLGHIHDLSLPELTQGLKACFKVLSKIQMPVAYMDLEPQSDMHSDQDLTQLKKVGL